ncbi:hypothetical protein EVC62_12795 [Salinicola endophyticus]|uniref:DUF7079 domain-containing protein n=1 Tax=Salinicola endophyticus TaxID=1949083 RepID=A0ABY8FID9_9GAMM|nr:MULTISPECIES: hypothetical protein [Salinicola]WFF42312.1 hypothetical protein EVC62_12795 [Salinicola endophyticus]
MSDEQEIEALIARRGALWLALSALWLEREPREADFARMVREIDASGLTLKELEWVYRLEMSPVMVRYQVSMAGEWRAFDENLLLLRLVRHNRRLGGVRKAVATLFSGLTTMMSRPRFDELVYRLMVARGERPPL